MTTTSEVIDIAWSIIKPAEGYRAGVYRDGNENTSNPTFGYGINLAENIQDAAQMPFCSIE